MKIEIKIGPILINDKVTRCLYVVHVLYIFKSFLVNCFIYIGPIICVVKVRYNVKMSLSDKKINFLSFFWTKAQVFEIIYPLTEGLPLAGSDFKYLRLRELRFLSDIDILT